MAMPDSSDALRFSSIGSGSRGNGTLVQFGRSLVLVDCGFSIKETEVRLSRLGIIPEYLDAIVVTHEHGDHINGVLSLSKKYNLPIYLTRGTARAASFGSYGALQWIQSEVDFSIGDLSITPVPVPHDACEPVQYIFSSGNTRLGILTDVGSLTAHIVDQYTLCDALVMESNHCPGLLDAGSYPQPLKDRIKGPWGHLSNIQCMELLSLLKKRLRHLVFAHLSEQNNHPDLVLDAFNNCPGQGTDSVYFASQTKGFDWLSM